MTYVVLVIVIIGCLYVYFENNDFDLKCIVSGVDGNKYCVRERSKLKEASNLLATVTKKCKDLVAYTDEHHGSKEIVKRLVKGFDQTVIKETLPTSKFTAYSENKGEKLAFCLGLPLLIWTVGILFQKTSCKDFYGPESVSYFWLEVGGGSGIGCSTRGSGG